MPSPSSQQTQQDNLLCLFFYKHPLPLPLGEVDERSEDGEGKLGCNALSVTFGDSSPKGRAKGCSFYFSTTGKLV